MLKLIKRIISSLLPISIIKIVFPNKYPSKILVNRFLKVKDPISKKSFYMYLREDSYLEKIISLKGLYGEWENESLKIWAELSKESQIIIDIGANTGIYSLLAQINNSKARILAIEPVDINFMVLSQNIKKNKVPIFSEKVALSDKDGSAKMFMLKDKLNYMTSVNDNRYANHTGLNGQEVVEIEVPIKTFKYIIDKYNFKSIDLIKIDVEGHEPNVVKAMLPYLKIFKPNLLIEIIGKGNAEMLDDMFRSIGYKFVSIDEKEKSKVVEKLWDNDHHNFLICSLDTIELLRSKHLVV